MTALTAGHNNWPGRTQFRGHNFGDKTHFGISGTMNFGEFRGHGEFRGNFRQEFQGHNIN